MKRIHLIHRDAAFATRFVAAFDRKSYDVDVFRGAEMALTAFFRNIPDAVVLDIGDEDLNGVHVMQKIRSSSTVPVILMTASPEEVDEIMGLRLGADAVLRQCTSTHLVAEWTRSLIRRHQELLGAGRDGKMIEKTLRAADLVMEPARMVALWRDKEIPLTMTEFRLLSALAVRPGVVKSREALMELIGSDGDYVYDRTIDSHMKRIRAKVREADPDFDCIQTVYGVGYRFDTTRSGGRSPSRRAELREFRARLNA